MPLKRGLYNIYSTTVPMVLSKTLGLIGYNISRQKDYYSPLPTASHLKKNIGRWYRPSELSGVKYDLVEMKELLTTLLSRYLDEFLEIPPYRELQDQGFGLGYTPVDALTLFLMIRHIKPARYIEVGSGLSTYYCSLAAKKNAEEGFPVKITCIEPYPFEKLYSITGIEILAKEVQNVEPAFFDQLQENDVFFIDSSHSLRVDSDVAYLYLEILPKLKNGVFIHVHDISFPYNIPYPPEFWILDKAEPMFWNEAMVLQALLSGNDSFEMLLSTPLIRFFEEDFLQKNIPIYETVEQNPNAFSSMWLKRTGQ
ncbi:MAG: class I SAM-dependent methyltransferase [Pyrinomonadaceae bacterium]|nr:class I SAM-dependent methyltransferase [Blastocatellia bacterium]MDQ3220462.1 class I SAM-dependent methyltransferase [Acidobacteriota bacterium]MDQ3489880.1 class I SAM-dependent methyltransferase [Acidobacteriota bacterium]